MMRAMVRSDTTAITLATSDPAALSASPGQKALAVVERNELRTICVADARLSNSDELAARLGVVRESPAHLILAAHARWGRDCVHHLSGDFAFAVWDEGSGTLFCARDPFGVRPFFFAPGTRALVFASELAGVLAWPFVDSTPDRSRIADYASGLVTDAESTFHRGVRRLPPGHVLEFDGTAVHLQRWWHIDALSADLAGDPAEGLRARLDAAVARCLKGANRPGALLSGGLDSSSIASLAARQTAGRPFATITQVYDATPDLNERRFAEAVASGSHMSPVFAPADDVAAFASLPDLIAEQQEPVLAPNLATSRLTYRVAASLGLDMLLDGHGGDEVVSHGYGRIAELARSGRFYALWTTAQGLAAGAGVPPWPVYLEWLKEHGPLAPVRSLSQRLKRVVGVIPPQDPERPGRCRYVSRQLARETHLADRYRAAIGSNDSQTTEAEQHRRMLLDPLIAHASEILDRSAAAAGVEARYPFYDLDLVAYCLALPAKEKLDGGWSRLVLRRAMQGLLPPEVQWRRDKLDFTPHIVASILRSRELVEAVLIDDAFGIEDVFDMEALRRAYQSLTSESPVNGYDMQAVWRAVFFGAWRAGQGRSAHAGSAQ
jgi:asparagine synthase (glutamine-hydrolysing)